MHEPRLSAVAVLVVVGALAFCQEQANPPAPSQATNAAAANNPTVVAQDAPPKKQSPEEQRADEKKVDSSDADSTGIIVGRPKVYDDSLLRQMLKAAQAKLASIQALDQTGIASHEGGVQGAYQTTNGLAISLQGPSTPQVATTNNGATNSTVSGDTNTVTAGAPNTTSTITTPQLNPPTVTAPAPSTSLPSSFSVSASDVLDEQMQLTYEIANLQLLLDGSLSDWTVGTSKIIKPRVTLGFPIAIEPGKREKDATAVVEIEIENDPKAKVTLGPNEQTPDELPAITTLLPREKTYNVARITDNSFAVSAGMAVQAISVGGAYSRGTKTYYLVKDIDTEALTYTPASPNRVGFVWQFRPVLGQRYVKAGLKQTFVQIAFPAKRDAANFGNVYVRTYWKYFDRKQGYSKRVQPHTLKILNDGKPWPIGNYRLDQNTDGFSSDDLTDLGNGQMLVNLPGPFIGGTYVRLGSTAFADGNPAFKSTNQGIQIVAPISDFATKDLFLVSRDGTERQIMLDHDTKNPPAALKKPTLTFTPIDDSSTLITADFCSLSTFNQNVPIVMLLAGKVYGYSDAPARWDGAKMNVTVPTSALLGAPNITFRSVLVKADFWKAAQFPALTYPQGTQAPKLVLLEQSDDTAKYLLYGAGLDKAKLLSPSWAKFDALPNDTSTNLRTVTLTKAQIKAEKQLVYTTADPLRFAIPFPSVDVPDVNKYNLKPLKPVVVGDDTVIFQGDGIKDLQKVTFNDVELAIKKQADNKLVWISGLKAAGATAEPKKQTLVFIFKSGKVSVDLTVAAKP